MLQTIALAITCFTCFVFENLTERFIRIVLEFSTPDLPLPLADRAWSMQRRKHRIIEKLSWPELR